jgi:antiviral helicase SKI2
VRRSLSRLKPEDRELPQITTLRAMLASGVAMHHAGLLPIMKEVVEMLFCEGLVRVLFATDTFAMGVNAPARSVTFWHINKPDGDEGLRMLRPEEYVQMAGRAGRRGLDDVGTVVVVAHQVLPCLRMPVPLRDACVNSH